jgi:hypothetical protein
LKRLSFLVLLLSSAPAYAEDGLTLSGNTRIRYETIDGQPRTGSNESDDLLNIRTILTGEYRTGQLKLGAELYDSRVYGGDAGTPITTNEVNTLELVQAYIGFDVADAFGPGTKLGLQAGRFTLNLGSRRLVAADDYRNTTNGYTGMRADLGLPDDLSATLIYTLPQVRLPDNRADIVDNRVQFDRENFDLVLWGGLATKKLAGKRGAIELGYYHLGERDSPKLATRDRSLDTIGLRLYRDPAPGRADFESETVYQFGSVSASLAPTAPKLDVSAWFTHLEAGYTFAHPWSPHLSLEFDYASGDGRGAKFGRFDTLFRHAAKRPGARRPLQRRRPHQLCWRRAVRLEVVADEEGSTALPPTARSGWHRVSTASPPPGVRDATGSSGRFAGHQLEARLRYWLVPKRLRLEWERPLSRQGPVSAGARPTHPPAATHSTIRSTRQSASDRGWHTIAWR